MTLYICVLDTFLYVFYISIKTKCWKKSAIVKHKMRHRKGIKEYKEKKVKLRHVQFLSKAT